MAIGSPQLRVRGDAEEQELLKAIAAGDLRALEELYVSYHRRVTRFLMRLVPRYETAEEVFNDTFWIVWQKAGEFRQASKVSTWIMGIAYRRMLKSLRSEKHASQLSAAGADPLRADCEEPTKDMEVREWVAHGLQALPMEQRLTLELAYYLGHSCEEIAGIMNCPVNTVKARMFHARSKLRHSLPRLGGDS
jgi:RNA polymerase sigma-70 factor, ECF subfamily